jgi:hypothetical protein
MFCALLTDFCEGGIQFNQYSFTAEFYCGNTGCPRAAKGVENRITYT